MARLTPQSSTVRARSVLPSVDAVLSSATAAGLLELRSRSVLLDEVRAVLDDLRAEVFARGAGRAESSAASSPSADDVAAAAGHRLERKLAHSLPTVVNATGVILHTNLGRAPLGEAAVAALEQAARAPVAVELDLESGERGQRDAHVADLLCELTGAEAALVVNNNAAALLLVIDTLAARREVLISRGELIEIGGSFRLPEVLARAGAILREVGTTNRTRVEDYGAALSRRAALVLRTHPSNYRIEGFTERPERSALAAVARAHGIAFVEDLGSGALVDLASYGLPHEPTPREALAAGADLVTFSGDKLLGGPQAGLVVGRADLIARLQKNPLKRALRVDKLILAALRATLVSYRSSPDLARDVPALALLARSEADLEGLGQNALEELRRVLPAEFELRIVRSEAQVGSGAQPTLSLPSRAIEVHRADWEAERTARLFRSASPAIVGRIQQGRLLLDLRGVAAAADLVPRDPRDG